MKAHQLIDGTSYGPDALKALGQAFDEAWISIAANFGNDPLDIEQARVNVEVLKKSALEAMALGYRRRADRVY